MNTPQQMINDVRGKMPLELAFLIIMAALSFIFVPVFVMLFHAIGYEEMTVCTGWTVTRVGNTTLENRWTLYGILWFVGATALAFLVTSLLARRNRASQKGDPTI